MAPEAGDLLGHVTPLGEQQHLGLETGGIDVELDACEESFEPITKPASDGLARFIGALDDVDDKAAKQLAATAEIGGKSTTFTVAHRLHGFDGPLDGCFHRAADGLELGSSGRSKEVGDRRKEREGHFRARKELIAELTESAESSSGALFIENARTQDGALGMDDELNPATPKSITSHLLGKKGEIDEFARKPGTHV
jgi:hypothetical protein